jgi:hypothetical protein
MDREGSVPRRIVSSLWTAEPWILVVGVKVTVWFLNKELHLPWFLRDREVVELHLSRRDTVRNQYVGRALIGRSGPE